MTSKTEKENNRAKEFKEFYLQKLRKSGHTVLQGLTQTKERCMYHIETIKFGKLNYYPKSNKIQVCRTGKWVKNGLEWIELNLLKYEENRIQI